MDDAHESPNARKDRRLFTITVLAGIAAGVAHGAPKYGFLSVGNAAVTGLVVILVVGVVAGVIALLPARSPD